MEQRLIALIISVSIFVLYKNYCLSKVGMTVSYSKTFYRLKRKYLYTLFMVAFAIPMSIAGDTPLMFWAAAAMVLTGVAADIKRSETTYWLHIVGANAGIAIAMLSIVKDYGNWVLPGLFVAFLIYALVREIRYRTLYIEEAALYISAFSILLDIWN